MPPDHDYIQRCLNAIKCSNRTVVDVETSGLDKHNSFICGYVFSVGPLDSDSFYLPFRHGGGGNISGCRSPNGPVDYNLVQDGLHPVEQEIKKIFSDPRKHWIGHNFKYDLWLLARHGIHISGTVEDTMVNASLINENQGKFDLLTCTLAMGVTPKVGDIKEKIVKYFAERGETVSLKNAMGHFWRLPGDNFSAVYATGDGISTFQLVDKQKEKIDEEGLDRVWSVEKRVTKTLFNMEYRGIPVDEKKLELVEKKIESLYKEAREKLGSDINVRSGLQVQKHMEKIGRTDWPTTEKGNPSFSESWLETFPEGQAIIRVRKVQNLINTFIEGSVRKNLYRGRIHCNFNQMKMDEFGTVSGRLSSSGPNMQQIPKRDKILAPLLRQIYRHPDLNVKWFSADYSQQEYRVFSEYAKAKLALEAYARNPDTDYHQLVADILSVDRDPDAKRINLGTIYNMGVKKLALTLGVDLAIAQGYMATMRRMMPEAKVFNKLAENNAILRGYVFTKLGRRRRFPDARFAHKAGNGVIQGCGADITKIKMVEIDEYLINEGCESQLILQVHDSLDSLYTEAERKHMDETVRIMESFGPQDIIQFSVPMKVDVSTGASWGHATFPKYDEWV